MAAKSYRRRIIGDFAQLLGGIPVERPQDLAKKGEGTISLVEGDRVKVLRQKRAFLKNELKKIPTIFCDFYILFLLQMHFFW